MAKTKKEKKEILDNIAENLKEQKGVYIVDFQNLKNRQLSILRKDLRENKALFCVAKKTLIDIAFQRKKIPINTKSLKGQIGIVFTFGESSLPAKILYKFTKEYNAPHVIKAYLENRVVEREEIIEIAELPSKQELLARLTNLFRLPNYYLINILKSNIKGLMYTLKSLEQKN